jgi:hypothetical protein
MPTAKKPILVKKLVAGDGNFTTERFDWLCIQRGQTKGAPPMGQGVSVRQRNAQNALQENSPPQATPNAGRQVMACVHHPAHSEGVFLAHK